MAGGGVRVARSERIIVLRVYLGFLGLHQRVWEGPFPLYSQKMAKDSFFGARDQDLVAESGIWGMARVWGQGLRSGV